MAQVLLSTTGTQSPVSIPDLGNRTFTHPTVNYDLTTEYSTTEISRSLSLQTAINNGWVTLVDNNLNSITDVTKVINSHNAITLPFAGESSSGIVAPYMSSVQKIGDGWVPLMVFPYRGTDQATMKNILLQISTDHFTGATFDVRFVISQSAPTTIICQRLALLGTDYSILTYPAGTTLDMGTISNLPAAACILEMQAQCNSQQDRDLNFYFLTAQF